MERVKEGSEVGESYRRKREDRDRKIESMGERDSLCIPQ